MLAAILLLAVALAGAAEAEDLLPDVIVVADRLGDIRIDTSRPGRTLLRLTAMTANIGRGRLEIRRNRLNTPEQRVDQRIYRSDDTFWDRPAGTTMFHWGHGHPHFDDWAIYRLREIDPQGGVGAVLAVGEKTSFCLLDLVSYGPGFALPANYRRCDRAVQGITPGYADIYDRELPDQWIDIHGVPDGLYWLEAEVDPEDKILEEDDTNNVARIQIAIGPVPPVVPDRYEQNDSTAQVDGREEAGIDSPNLGLVNTRLEIEQLSVRAGDSDFFKFRTNHTGTPGDFVRIESPYLGSDLDLALLDSDGRFVRFSVNVGNFDQVSLEGIPAGEYYAWVLPFAGANPAYRLIIDLAANAPPELEVLEPTQSGIWVERAFETFPVSWIASDPEGDPVSVSLFIDRDRILDKQTQPLGGYQHLDAEAGGVNINTAQLELGEWFVYVEATDGGAITGAWAPGTVTLYTTQSLSCELKVGAAGPARENSHTRVGRVGKSLHFETHNLDPNLEDIWASLFDVFPGASPDDSLMLQAPDLEVRWPAGQLTMGGQMRLKVKPSKRSPGASEVTLEKASKKSGVTEFVSATGGVNPDVADGGWHEVKIKDLGNVSVDFNGYRVTGFLKELKVKLDKNSTLRAPIVKDFKIKILGATDAPAIKKGSADSVVLWAPETVVTAIAGTEYKEKIKDSPALLLGHTEAAYHRDADAPTEGIDIQPLFDGSNDLLKERKGPCTVIDDG